MTLPTQPLRDEHSELYPEIPRLRALAQSLSRTQWPILRDELEHSYRFLNEHLIPHAIAEEGVLYPTIDTLLGSPLATAPMRRDHEEVARLTRELELLLSAINGHPLTPHELEELRATLYALSTIVALHFEKEESIYLPLLDERLTVAAGRDLVTRMHEAAAVAAR